jgi:hypothetical protein
VVSQLVASRVVLSSTELVQPLHAGFLFGVFFVHEDVGDILLLCDD